MTLGKRERRGKRSCEQRHTKRADWVRGKRWKSTSAHTFVHNVVLMMLKILITFFSFNFFLHRCHFSSHRRLSVVSISRGDESCATHRGDAATFRANKLLSLLSSLWCSFDRNIVLKVRSALCWSFHFSCDDFFLLPQQEVGYGASGSWKFNKQRRAAS